MLTLRSFRRRLPVIVLALVPAVALAFGNLHSNLFIDAGKQFVLGGSQRGTFRVKGKNVGTVPVRVVERLASGDTLSRGTLAPSARADLRFQRGSAALLINPSGRQANLSLDISGDLALGMTYEGLEAPR